jgi:parvulin-like peptidyl-prolyl isomerase
MVSNLKEKLPLTLLVLFMALYLLSSPAPVLASTKGGSSVVVASVNGAPIFSKDLNCAVEVSLARTLISQSRRSEKKITQESVTSETLSRLINIELLYQESLKNRFEGLVKLVEDNYQKELTRLGGEKQLKVALKCNGMTPDQFKQNIFRNLSISRYLNKMVYSRIEFTDLEIAKFYRENISLFARPPSARVSQLFVRIPRPTKKAEEEAMRKAMQIHAQAEKGSDFSVLVRKYSDDAAGVASGGDMGVIFKGNLRHGFDTVVFSLQPGKVSKPLRSSSGIHIFKVYDMTSSRIPPLDEIRNAVTSRLRKQKAEEGVKELVEQLRSKAEIVIY